METRQNFQETQNQQPVSLTEIKRQITEQTEFLTSQINQLQLKLDQIITTNQFKEQIYARQLKKLKEEKLNQTQALNEAKLYIQELNQKNQHLNQTIALLNLQIPQNALKSPAESTISIPPGNFQTFRFESVTVNEEGKINKRFPGEVKYVIENLGEGVNLELIYIPGGSFLMGTEKDQINQLCKKYHTDRIKSEQPQHQVTVKPFLMAKYPLTQAQWKIIASRSDLKVNIDLDPEISFYKGDNFPVERVSWHQATEYCLRLSLLTEKQYRLPSEAEWEYACRAGSTTPFYFGEAITTHLANFNGNYTYAATKKGIYRARTTEVGIFPPNVFGLYDLHGSVWEWCADSWHENYENAPTDGSIWLKEKKDSGHKVLRGGSWYSGALGCRSAYRFNYASDDFYDLIGFRPVCEL